MMNKETKPLRVESKDEKLDELRRKLTHVFIATPASASEGLQAAKEILRPAIPLTEADILIALGLFANGIASELEAILETPEPTAEGEPLHGTECER